MQICATSPTISPALPQVAPATPATDPTTDLTVSPEPTSSAAADPTAPAAPPVPPSKFLQKLASGHFNAVADLRHRMRLADEIDAADLKLPEPAAPRGNGKAYAKFLAAYKASQPSATTSPAPEPTPPAVADPTSSQLNAVA